MKIIKLILLFIVLGSFGLRAQRTFKAIENDLSMYNDYFINADKPEHRIIAHEKFNNLITKALKKTGSFYYPFDSLKWISRIIAPDSSFRVFSWQLQKSDSEIDYFGLLQTKRGRVYQLLDNKDNINDFEYAIFTDDDWFGQLYYNIYQYKERDNSNNYILFGYKIIGDMEKVKTAIPVSFDEKHVYFGEEIFKDTVGTMKTLISLKTYARSASSLRFSEDKQIIIYDHTVTLLMPDRFDKLRPANVPDGSYHGYKWDGRYWQFIDKVYTSKLNEAPRDKKRDNLKKGLFGN